MMKQEFNRIVKEKGGEEVANQAEYNIIETVYTWYDERLTKAKTADLYLTFGMKVFYDMLPRAEKIRDIQSEIDALNKKIRELEEYKEGVITGN